MLEKCELVKILHFWNTRIFRNYECWKQFKFFKNSWIWSIELFFENCLSNFFSVLNLVKIGHFPKISEGTKSKNLSKILFCFQIINVLTFQIVSEFQMVWIPQIFQKLESVEIINVKSLTFRNCKCLQNLHCWNFECLTTLRYLKCLENLNYSNIG